MTTFHGRTLVAGHGHGDVLILREPLSFWGGFDPETGTVIDTHHPQLGVCLSGRVLFMKGRGSSSSPSVLAESIRLGTAPVAIVLAAPEPVIALGAMMAAELYGVSVPVAVVTADDRNQIEDGTPITVDATRDEAVLELERG